MQTVECRQLQEPPIDETSPLVLLGRGTNYVLPALSRSRPVE